MFVEKGDTIYIPANDLGGRRISVRSSRAFSNGQEEYRPVTFFNRSKGNEQGILFVQTSWVDRLENKVTGRDDLTVIVDDDFQYGQDKGNRVRWLAYNDKGFTTNQWRFIDALQSSFGAGAAADFAGGSLRGIDVNRAVMDFQDRLQNF